MMIHGGDDVCDDDDVDDDDDEAPRLTAVRASPGFVLLGLSCVRGLRGCCCRFLR